MWLNYLVINHVVITNPVGPVKGPRHSQNIGKTPVLSIEQARCLVDAIDSDTIARVPRPRFDFGDVVRLGSCGRGHPYARA